MTETKNGGPVNGFLTPEYLLDLPGKASSESTLSVSDLPKAEDTECRCHESAFGSCHLHDTYPL